MSFILADGWLITMNDRREILEDASVCVQNDRIAAIARADAHRRWKVRREI